MQKTELVLKDIPISFKKWYLKAFKEAHENRTIDVFAEYDRKLNIAENKNLFLGKFNALLNSDYKLELQAKQTQKAEEKFKIEQLNKIKEEEKKLIKEWKKSDFEEINIKSFDVPKHFLKMLCRGFCNSVVLVGEGGIGKSYLTINILKEEKQDFEYLNTHTSPLELYKWIYYNKDKVLIFDDVKGLLDNEKSVSILKACLWETDGKRMVTMNTTDRYLQDVPKIFEFKGKMIILANKLNLNDEHLNALITRTNYFELNFSYKEKLRIMSEIMKKPYKNTQLTDRQKALDLLIKNTDITTQDLNFRTLIKTFDYLLYDEKKAENLLISTLKIDENLKLVKELMESAKSVNEQIAEFILKTGKSRITYFRYKEQIKKLMR